MIITKLNGGLGNQMFEYAHARSLQLTYNDTMYLDIEGFRHSNPKYPKRNYSLAPFYLSSEVKILDIKKSKKLLFCQLISKLNYNIAKKIFKLFDIYIWKHPGYVNFDISDTRNKKYYFYGYWQSDKYFSIHKDVIKKELQVKEPITKEALPFIYEANKDYSVCVHIRRGDYVDANMIMCNEEYYLNGMDYIKNKYRNCNFLIFSDDINWVKNNIHFKYPVKYVTISEPDYEVMRIMYSCKHFIISNSSFSWWGQYLSENTDKIVIAPEKWFPNNDNKDIYQKNWIIL